MLKKFYKLELNSLSSKILSYWEKDFNFSIDKHKDFLSQNFENQEKYSSKFSEILENMDVFSSENDENKEEDNEKNDAQENNSQNNENDQSESKSDSKENETQSILDTGFDLSDQQLNEQLEDLEDSEESSENITKNFNIFKNTLLCLCSRSVIFVID